MYKDLLGWLFSVHVFEVAALFAAGIGVTLALSPERGDVTKAHWFFAAAFLLSFGRIAQLLMQWETASHIKYVVAFLLFGTLGMGWLGVYTWVDGKLQPAIAAPQVKPSGASLQLKKIEAFKDFSVVEAGRKLAFRATFDNPGPMPVTRSAMMIASAVTWDIANQQTINIWVSNLRSLVAEAKKNTPLELNGPPVAIGTSIYKDIVTPPLDAGQASGILAGTARVYLVIWANWDGADGLSGESELCVYLNTPRSKHIEVDDIKNWGVCPIPAKPPA